MDINLEKKLVLEAKNNFESFDKLYEYYFPKLYSFVRSKLINISHTEDIVADIFIKVMDALPQFEWKNVPFGAFIFKVARNYLYDYYQKTNYREAKSVSIEEAEQIKDEGLTNNPQHQASLNEVQKIIYSELKNLNPREKDVVEMKFFGQLKNNEIAKVLNISARNVGVILFRTLKKLKNPLSIINY